MSVTQSNNLHNLLIILVTYYNICINCFNFHGANLNTIRTFKIFKRLFRFREKKVYCSFHEFDSFCLAILVSGKTQIWQLFLGVS